MTDERSEGAEHEATEAIDPTHYYDVLAPLPEKLPWDELDALREFLAGVYDQGAELFYYDYALRNLGLPGVANTWGVAVPDDGDELFVAVINLAGFRDITELQVYLDELVSVAPGSRTEWTENIGVPTESRSWAYRSS